MDTTKYILLFECCRLTKGASRTLLIDSERKNIEFLDNEIYDLFISKNKTQTIESLLSQYDSNTSKIIKEYLEFLIEKEYAFLCEKSEIDFFPPLNLEWDHYSTISNCIIDFKHQPLELNSYKQLLSDLDDLGCEAIQIRDYNGLTLSFLNDFLKLFDKTILYKIELLLKCNDELENYKKLLDTFPRITELILHSYTSDNEFKNDAVQNVILTKQVIMDETCCGVVASKYFNLDMDHFLESLNHNTCLNRKVGIDSNGNIKNCPSMKINFGNINTVSIKEVISNPDFTKAWGIKKDTIEDCKICEFRNICTDCRAYLGEEINLKKPAKCNYNPVKMSWG